MSYHWTIGKWWTAGVPRPARRSCKDHLHPCAQPVPCRGFDPHSPALQAGAFTRLAYRANWSGQSVTIRRLLPGEQKLLPLSYGRVVGRGWIRTSEPLKGRRLQRRCFGLLHTCPCWLRRAELNGLPLGHEPSELPVLHSASNGVGLFIPSTARRYARDARELAEGRGLDPQWLPIHPASNGRLAPAGLTFRNGGRLSARCPYALSVPRGFQPAPGPCPVSLP